MQQSFDEAAQAAAPVKAKIKAAVAKGSKGPVRLSQEEANAILLAEAMFLQLHNPYGRYGLYDFYNAMQFADGWFVEEGHGSVQFELLDVNGNSTSRIHYGSDINYSYLGMVIASTGRHILHMESAIEIWNIKQMFERSSIAYDFHQIPVGKYWMRFGHQLYQEASIK